MDSEKSPSDDHNSFNSDDELLIDPDQSEDMAVAVAHMPQPFLPPPSSTSPIVQSSTTMNKRYRPAPAKTFQCRGYGECRMVFSRSEHLARHIRKHTGERPFTCHCGKQFSRLDNLRQHAQTVHSDKQEQNERMMHELTSLHATMTAATKGSAPRGKRGQAAAAASAGSNNILDGTLPAMSIKQEDGAHSMSMRPGTSTGYEGGDGEMYHSTGNWSSDIDRHQPQQQQLSTISHSSTVPASPFSPQQHSTSVSPTSQTIPPAAVDPELLVALQIDPSHPSLPSSPHPSLPPSLSRNHPYSNHRSSSRSSGNSTDHHSHPHTFYPYPPRQHRMASMDEDLPQPLAPAPLQHPTTMAVATHNLSVQDLEYQQWSHLAQNYHYRSPLDMDGAQSDLTTGHYTEATMITEERNQPHLLEDRMTLHFPSTHQPRPHPHQRPSPPLHPMRHRPSPIRVSDPTQDPTMGNTMIPVNVTEEMYAQLAAAGAVQLQATSTSTDPNLGHNLDGSPSWNSAMTPILTQQLGQLYPYQALQRHHSVHHAQQPHLDSSQVHLSSPSSIGRPLPSSPAHNLPSTPTTGVSTGAHLQYSQDLHRQQEEQMYLRMRREEEAEQRYREQEYIEHQRRKSEEELHQQYLMHLEEYPINTNVTSNNSPSPHGLQYFPQQAYDGDLRHHSSEDLRGHLELGMDGQMYQHHPTQMVAYPLAPLDLQVEGNPTGMIKYESP
ncbi:hypothetical protein PHLCEN_2v916 [Hermanssonia centrifuga]|uniref:C2H2-type domain-containing protein n=1 Tax=Hermanssonia centrifuga TaxID=98765 RepID=A0A2R6S4L1_9APHY|nr:hypothetical protein PHLCEN_2v916 [Hermanssonia centrifuga]